MPELEIYRCTYGSGIFFANGLERENFVGRMKRSRGQMLMTLDGLAEGIDWVDMVRFCLSIKLRVQLTILFFVNDSLGLAGMRKRSSVRFNTLNFEFRFLF